MKTLRASSILSTLLFTFTAPLAFAAENGAPDSAPTATAPKPSQAGRRTAALIKELKLTDAGQETRTREILESHLAAMEQWHETHDSVLAPLWSEWAAKRNQHTKVEAAKVGEKVDAVYANFRPQRDAFLAALVREIGPAGVEKIKNALTRSPGMDRTANAYIEMIPQFTEADKAFVRARFALAREQAIDTTAGKEIESFFKRQKDIVEAFIDEKGYDYKKSRAAWVAKMNAANAASKASQPEPKKE